MVGKIKSGTAVDMPQAVEDFQVQLMMAALNQSKWVIQHAANLLGVTRPTLIYKMKIMGISPAPAAAQE